MERTPAQASLVLRGGLRHILRGTRFDSEVPSGHANVVVYRFRSEDSPSRDVYAVWCPTSDSTAIRDFRLALRDASAATLITLTPHSTTGQAVPLTIEDGEVIFGVCEQPVFVTVP